MILCRLHNLMPNVTDRIEISCCLMEKKSQSKWTICVDIFDQLQFVYVSINGCVCRSTSLFIHWRGVVLAVRDVRPNNGCMHWHMEQHRNATDRHNAIRNNNRKLPFFRFSHSFWLQIGSIVRQSNKSGRIICSRVQRNKNEYIDAVRCRRWQIKTIVNAKNNGGKDDNDDDNARAK